MVLKVSCPTVHVPDAARHHGPSTKKRSRGDMGWHEDATSYQAGAGGGGSSSSSSSSSQRGRFIGSSSSGQQKDVDLKALFSTVKDFSATSFTGMKKKHHKEDKLTKLGAPPVKQQKMPFKMKIGILAGRKKRDEITEKNAQESGVVLARVASQKVGGGRRNSSSSFQKKKPRRSGDSSSIDINTKGGVLHLSSKRLPSRLTKSFRK